MCRLALLVEKNEFCPFVYTINSGTGKGGKNLAYGWLRTFAKVFSLCLYCGIACLSLRLTLNLILHV